MAAYVIGNTKVLDPKAYEVYRAQVLATIEKFGGRFLVRGGAFEVLEGTWQPTRLVVLEFPDKASLDGWYRSSDYASLIKLRQAAAFGDLVAVEGV